MVGKMNGVVFNILFCIFICDKILIFFQMHWKLSFSDFIDLYGPVKIFHGLHLVYWIITEGSERF